MTAKKTDVETSESLGRGHKRCPSCGEVVAARAPRCRHCGHDFLKTSKKGVTVRRSMPDQTTVKKLVEFINSHGGLENAKRVVADIQALSQHIGDLNALIEELNLVNLIKHEVKE